MTWSSGIFKYAPISGTVEEINGSLADQPGLLNKSPEDEGESVDLQYCSIWLTLHNRLALQNQVV